MYPTFGYIPLFPKFIWSTMLKRQTSAGANQLFFCLLEALRCPFSKFEAFHSFIDYYLLFLLLVWKMFLPRQRHDDILKLLSVSGYHIY